MEFIQEKKEIPINSSQEDAPTSNLNPLDRKTTTGYVHPRERLAYGTVHDKPSSVPENQYQVQVILHDAGGS